MIDSLSNILENLTGGNRILFHAVLGFIINMLVVAVGKILKWILGFIGKRIISKTETELDDEILSIINSKIIALSSVVGIYLGMKELRLGLTKQNEFFLSFLDYADMALYLVTVVIVASVLTRTVRTVISHGIRAISEKQKHEQFNLTLIPLVNRVVSIVIVAFTAIVVLEHFGQSVTSLITILGAGSLALGLAAQETISNMISGFIIMIDRPFRVGDRVKIPSGETGDVYEIGLRSTKILDFDNNVLIVPNNELIKTKIVNFGYPGNEIRVVVEVTVAYGSDIEKVKELLLSIARSHPSVLTAPAPEVFLMKLGDYGLHFSLFCRVSEFKHQFLTAENIRVRIYNSFNKAKIEIPYPRYDVRTTYESSDALHTSQTRKKISR
ncbi:MAG: mechanosensitive ion channel [Bacteroidetes bacterium]|nr:mechanosensitive ion channel [Bacteroidota bacterium]